MSGLPLSMMRSGILNAGTRDRDAKSRQFAPASRDQISAMITLLTILVALAMAGTLGILLFGMLGMVRGNRDPMQSNRLMRWRIILQGVALLLFVLLLSLLHA